MQRTKIGTCVPKMSSIGCCCAEENTKAIMSSLTEMSSLHILLCFSPNLYIQSVSYSISKESLPFGLSFDVGLFMLFCFVWPVQLFECKKYGFGDDIPVITLKICF